MLAIDAERKEIERTRRATPSVPGERVIDYEDLPKHFRLGA